MIRLDDNNKYFFRLIMFFKLDYLHTELLRYFIFFILSINRVYNTIQYIFMYFFKFISERNKLNEIN
jgi:hypothetical protein